MSSPHPSTPSRGYSALTAASIEAQVEPGEGSYTPRVGSELYTEKQYWEWRFSREEQHEWLSSYAAIQRHVKACIPDSNARILLVGNGNSRLPMDMAADGYSAIVASDYSDTVVRRMQALHAASVEWCVQDMTELKLPDASFDAVIDKAAMDAVLAHGGDVWDPPADLLAVAERICSETARVLRPGGVYMQLSFSQPHFRMKYIDQVPGRWAITRHSIATGFGYFLYVCVKPTSGTEA